ncbi:MAG: CDP-alcohol phosphatidyltransferase family protein [Methylococcales bacterium]|nr:CDP-alcohol phosphatidyltransferase family protein [Methylococcales bacterium]
MKYELKKIALLGGVMLLAGFGGLAMAVGWAGAGQWLLQASLLWVLVCHCVWQRFPLNKADLHAPLYRHLGWGNRLTVLRGFLIALTGGFIGLPTDTHGLMWLPAAFYTSAAILDRFDGWAARRSQHVSLLGNELDIRFDALGLVIAPLLAISLGVLHGSYLLLSVAFYLYQWQLQSRIKLGLPVHALPPNLLRRTLAGFQMGLVAVTLWQVLHPALTQTAGLAFMLPVLFGFIVDWWIVTGRLTAEVLVGLERFSVAWWQPGLRLVLVLVLVLVLLPYPHFAPDINIVLWVLAGLILVGYGGRVAAGLLIVLLGWQYPIAANPVLVAVLIVTASWILLLGTGRYSLWHSGDEWLTRYEGS